MSLRRSDTRQRVVLATAQMLAQHGLNATSIRAIAQRAQSPLGSTYHHFPEGKQQVVTEAVTWAGAQVSEHLAQQLQAGAGAGLRDFLALWRETLLRSDFHAGCPVLAVAVQEPLDEAGTQALDAAAQVFAQWQAQLAGALQAQGVAPEQAAGLATLIVAATEGAIALCRAERSIAAFDRTAAQLRQLLPS